MKIFVTSALFVIAVVSIKIENEFGLGLPGSGMAYNNFLVLFAV